jgi:signal peptidase I
VRHSFDRSIPAPSQVLRAVAVSILFTPMGGYVALAQWRRSLVFAAAESALVLLAVGATLEVVPWAMWTICLLVLGVFVAGVVDVGRLARRTPAGRQRWPRALLGALAVTLLVIGFQPIRANALESFRSPTNTMLPTLAQGDWFFVDKRVRPLQRGDVVVFSIPSRLTSEYALRVKRAVALGGDTVELRNGNLIVNGTPVNTRQVGTVKLQDGVYEEWEEAMGARTYRVLRVPGGSLSTFGPVTVLAGHFFMLGDNRDRNHDSRMYESMPLDTVVGRAIWIWWSQAPDGHLRWDRFSRRL